VSMKFNDAVSKGGFVITAECIPPHGGVIDSLKSSASSLSSLVNAAYVPECKNGIRMSALAASRHLIDAGMDAILQLTTRDMNRIALQAALLGAVSMGIKSVVCTTGKHQALTSSKSARGVFDVDPIQLLAIADGMRKNGIFADGQLIEGKIDFLLGVETNPFSENIELQVMTLEKAIAAGADFVFTQPVFKLDKFNEWMNLVRQRKLHENVCIIATVLPLSSIQQAVELSEAGSNLDVGEDVLKRLESMTGVALASEIATTLKATEGVRGICIMAGDDANLAKDVLTTSGIAGS